MDTTAEFGSLALIEDGAVVEELPIHSPEGFGHVLFSRIQELLGRHALKARQIQCFAAGAGPGSFTGVRVGLTAAKGLADAVGVSVVGVSNLRAIASFGTGAVQATLLDARRGEVYAAVFGGTVEQPELVSRFPEWLAQLPEQVTEFVAQEFGPFAAVIGASRFADRRFVIAPRALAGAIGLLAWGEFIEGRAQDPAAVDANYVRRSDAELLWKELP